LKAVLLDSHSWAWSLDGDRRLSAAALEAIEAAQNVLVSPITFFEIAQKVRLGKGKWPKMEPFVNRLPALLAEQGGSVAALEPKICVAAGLMPWVHRDPFDRLPAATATHHSLPIISADSIFDGVVTRLW
jgi:PIN domain nuclease of toxin-antitoxin system